MSPKYLLIRAKDARASIAVKESEDTLRCLDAAEILALLNTPTPPAAGVVWRKPGEPGRVDRKMYLVTPNGLDCWSEQWNKTSPNDGWHSSDLIAWADLPSPPAWAGGAA